MTIKQCCDKCGYIVDYGIGATITMRTLLPIGEIDLCPKCRGDLSDIVYNWLNGDK